MDSGVETTAQSNYELRMDLKYILPYLRACTCTGLLISSRVDIYLYTCCIVLACIDISNFAAKRYIA